MNKNNSNTELVQLYEALISAGFFKNKDELILFLFKCQNEILIAFNEFQKEADLRG